MTSFQRLNNVILMLVNRRSNHAVYSLRIFDRKLLICFSERTLYNVNGIIASKAIENNV